MDIRHFFSKFRLNFRNKTRGYVVLLLVVFVPLVMLGTKLALDLMTMHDLVINSRTSGPAYRKCAEKAALSVAQNWNPGRSLDHQKRAVLKVADQVYNDCLNSLGNVPELAKAVPGIQLSVNSEVIIGKGFDPIRVKTRAIPSTINQIKYLSAPKYLLKRQIVQGNSLTDLRWNLPFVSWKLIDKLTSETTPYDKFDELDQNEYQSGKYVLNHIDRYIYPHQRYVRTAEGYPTRASFLLRVEQGMDVDIATYSSTTANTDESGYTDQFTKSVTEANAGRSTKSKVSAGTYTYRENENDSSVQVSVESDKIKVQTDYDIGYATPAECNVDIVLACPTNGAACNKNNRDQNSTTPEMPYLDAESGDILGTRTEPPADAKSCLIYQIGQALRVFAKEFYHIRGVTMGLIPYSGKVSLDPDVANGYTMTYYTYNYNRGNFCTSSYISNQNSYQAYLRGTILYDSYGMTNAELNNGYSWNSLLTACPIRCRGRSDCITGDHAKTGNNCICLPDILSNAAPGDRTKFFKQNSNPCYGGYANLLTMRCEKNCTVYLPNPYYIIEPTADVQKIYEICGALYPFYDEYNVSNFLFIPITWANNLWQNWTRNPEQAAVDTDASGNGGQLEIPSKMKEGRKKVLILVVNKPDWFEPHELTYLGFDNDFSELCMIESDRIDFSQDYKADSSKKFADGSSYDGTIQGPKKILKVSSQSGISRNANSGYYECSSGSLTLSFPKKYLVKVVVETPDFKITNLGSELGASTSLSNWNQIASDGNKYIALNEQGYIAHSTDAKHWSNRQQMPSQWLKSIIYANDIWMIAGDGGIFTGDGNSWTNNGTIPSGYNAWYDFTYGNGIWFGTNFWFTRGYSNDNGVSWNHNQNTSAFFRSNFSVTYMNGLWFILDPGGGIKTNPGGELHTFPDDSRWTSIGNRLSSVPSSGWRRIRSGKKFLVALNDNGNVAYSRDNGNTWKYVSIGESSTWTGLNHIENDRFIACSNEGYTSLVEHASGTVVFTNISSIPGTDKKEFTFEGRREFYIEPSQMNGNSIDISLKNIRLISAEITNRPYIKTTPTCSFDGTNIKTNVKRPITVKVNPLPHGTVTFSDIDDTEIANAKTIANADSSKNPALTDDGREIVSGEAIEIRKPTTFTFPEGCFSKKYDRDCAEQYPNNIVFSSKKLSYNLNKVKITSVTLKNQMLRLRGYRKNRGEDYKDPSFCLSNSSSDFNCLTNSYFWVTSPAREPFKYKLKNSWISRAKLYVCFYNASNDGRINYWDLNGILSYKDLAKGTSTKNIDVLIHRNGENKDFVAEVQKFDYYLAVYWLQLYNLDDCCLNLSNISDSSTGLYITGNNTINFEGQGELSITAEPTGKKGIITYLAPNDSSIPMVLDEPQTITIDPDSYKYEKGDDGSYTIKLTCDNVELSDLQLVDTSDVFTWDKIRMPDKSMYADYSKNPYELNMSWQTGSYFTNNWEHDGYFYTNKNNGGYSTEFGNSEIVADRHSLTYSEIPYEIYNFCDEGWSSSSNRKMKQYFSSGLTRIYTPSNRSLWKDCAFSDYIAQSPRTISFLMQTGTLPINTALYYAYYNTATHGGEWYKEDKSGNYDYDASNASKNVTVAACKKLNDDFGNNLRIYLIKYRKQTQYKHKITSNVTDYEYGYMDKCKSDTDTTKAAYTFSQDISSEADLKSALTKIASEVKPWAEYKEAKNVTP